MALHNSGGRGLVLINSQLVSSAVATVDFTGLDDTYDSYVLSIGSAKPASDDVVPWLRVATSGTFQTSGYSYALNWLNRGGIVGGVLSSSDAAIVMSLGAAAGNDAGNAAGEAFHAEASFNNPEQADFPSFQIAARYNRAVDSTLNIGTGGGQYNTAGSITGVRFLFSSGNVVAGRFSLYGLLKA